MTLVSKDSAGVQGNMDSVDPSVSEDGLHVAFQSKADNLVSGDGNAVQDIFVHDLPSGVTERASVATGGGEANQASLRPSISGDGRYATFDSLATNLVPGDTNAWGDVFVRDRQAGQTTRVSVSSNGAEGNDVSYQADISGDGRYVAFESGASNLVPADANASLDIFVHDRQTSQTTRVSVSSSGAEANAASFEADISADGRYVAFWSLATNLVPGDTNGVPDAFVHDRQTGQTTVVSVDSSGTQGNGDSAVPSISGDGRYVAFWSLATNLVPGDTNGYSDAFVHDRQTGQTSRVSVATGGGQGSHSSYDPSISSDGRFVSFPSNASNLVPGDTNFAQDVFRHDRLTQTTVRLSVDSAGGQANFSSVQSSISGAGQVTGFTSYATNLVLGDANAAPDVFASTCPPSSCQPATAYCTPKVSSSGCTPSIAGVGAPSLGNPTGFTVNSTGLEDNKFALTFFGTSGQNSAPFQGGFLCVKLPVHRLLLQNTGGNGACTGAVSYTLQDMLNHPFGGSSIAVGATVDAQTWFRDPAAASTSGLSDGLECQVCP